MQSNLFRHEGNVLSVWRQRSSLEIFTVASIPQQQLAANKEKTKEKYTICGPSSYQKPPPPVHFFLDINVKQRK